MVAMEQFVTSNETNMRIDGNSLKISLLHSLVEESSLIYTHSSKQVIMKYSTCIERNTESIETGMSGDQGNPVLERNISAET
jgi:hypothetical protein